MSDTAIKVQGLDKCYRLGGAHAQAGSLAGSLSTRIQSILRRRSQRAPRQGYVWALRDVSFEVKKGEVFGIIGTNGSGKSTLLKILSRVTEPSGGRAIIEGRFCGLLEVGTGFHPELTGRDNVFMSGAILGMKRQEIARKFDEIISFAEVEKFIDTPVKHYSSGMYVRLGFSVLAHMDPDILIVDEVLAVGDARFQKKCMAKMEDVGQQGRTVLLVSHDMSAVARLCKRAILLRKGEVAHAGTAQDVVNHYLHGDHLQPSLQWMEGEQAPANEVVRLQAIRVVTESGMVASRLDIRSPIDIELEYKVLKAGHIFVPGFALHNEEDAVVFIVHDRDPSWQRKPRLIGVYTSTVRIPSNFLAEGTFRVSVTVMTESPFRLHAYVDRGVGFTVEDRSQTNCTGRSHGVVRPLLEWKTIFAPK